MAIAASTNIAQRTARTIWTGRLASGSGAITSGSGALGELPVTWAARTQQSNGQTSPEELAAAAHASCFSMALALRLGEHQATARRIDVGATVSLDDVDGKPTVATSALVVHAEVPDLDKATFDTIIEEAAGLCPISRLFAGAQITIDATLDPS
ncbi:MAG: OsmC family peroxiredoxin [Candidatus Limnocylindrales bacterium]